ncbi:hypothetical protein NUW54_g14755 [Trametes sanguinea]|uniref:Uncharacterized protein n=1 Tax=Trametes sanguinea TaxID=158606 RepID=A0ACC1MCJ9_9APHY|nr:hypothetical protein NUW54_g14755 [Trametes sanguinea]
MNFRLLLLPRGILLQAIGMAAGTVPLLPANLKRTYSGMIAPLKGCSWEAAAWVPTAKIDLEKVCAPLNPPPLAPLTRLPPPLERHRDQPPAAADLPVGHREDPRPRVPHAGARRRHVENTAGPRRAGRRPPAPVEAQ